ncbi:interleukin-4 receptor subunit alpha-like [Molossus molossus]|uniref:interleukin-4 receptor subunit alpha-like n=1 Tax=Molossus molossus TaxID=27622 RepID=UPI001746A320|nr:interleukin-4 receptor subunit alpha-like [Molossus molossus]XP_036134719.1 interleukin-4 receptor subunit alpha-like [Molossus molossus]XP_036134720.1 interleukin-4 receptor subunit alpha-like [Molossus molossus]XP_036134721.1 interleukin-4 receptor subunit alpha-like [Molossus molossus]XP_036134722.1 interleukin-4 receptor subunit alpha-like [Molossus molossus]
MGWLGSGFTFPVSCLILVWAADSGCVRVRHPPTCFSDYISTSTCEWRMSGPTNCSAELRLTYQLDFLISENGTCVPENRESTVCLCNMLMDNVASVDIYQLDLWAGKQQLWTGSFQPSKHVKPMAPGNLTVASNDSHMWQLTWSNPYPPENFLYDELSYQVNISNEDDPSEFTVNNVTYMEPTLRFSASILKPWTFYSARVRAWAQIYNSTWSEWSPSVKWFNYLSPPGPTLTAAHPQTPGSKDYVWPWEQHLPLALSISCIIIVVICLSCYWSIIKIKKDWWDQIPNPAHSPLVAVVIQESQVSLWRRRSGGQEPAKCPHWKTCLTKLLPCLLEHGVGKEDSSFKDARSGPVQAPGKSAWRPVEVSRTILWPESISVVKCVELSEAPVEVECEEEEDVEEDQGSFCSSPESSRGGFQDSREGIVARLTESLFLDLLGGENGDFCPPGLGESCLLPPSESVSAQMPWAELPSAEPQEAALQGPEQLLSPECTPAATLTGSPACLAPTQPPAVIVTDNPFYRSFSSVLSQCSGPGELDSDPQLAEGLGDGDPDMLSAPQPSEPPAALAPEPESWEQVLRRSVLQHQHGAAGGPAAAPSSGYRQFAQAVRQGAQGGGEAGYKAFSSLLPSGALRPGTSGAEASSGEGCYKPFRSLPSGCPGVPAPVPLFTFGLDLEPHGPQRALPPGSSPGCPALEPGAKGEDSQKPPLSREQASGPLGDDLGSGIVYSALTCHLCGHLKQCHGQEERGEAHAEATRCCGCCCGDRCESPVSPLPGAVPLEASLPASLGGSDGGKSSLSFQPGPSNAQGSSQAPAMVAVLSTGPPA